MRHLDLASPDMVSAEMTRADVEAALASHQTDFTGKRLSGLDLSGLTSRASGCALHVSTRPSLLVPSSTAPSWTRRGSWMPT